MKQELFAVALDARSRAYCPYSGYQVGAAVLGVDGMVYSGCNVENVSFGACICAERFALGAMVRAGCLKWTEIVVVTRDGGTPCGICRQCLAELAVHPDTSTVYWANLAGLVGESPMAGLLPHAFYTDGLTVRKD